MWRVAALVTCACTATGCFSIAQRDPPTRPWSDHPGVECSDSGGYPGVAALFGIGFGVLGALTYVNRNENALLFDGNEVLGTLFITVGVVEVIDSAVAYHDMEACREYLRTQPR